MKKQISVLLVVLLLLLTALPASAETTAKSIPFSGWAQGETGNAWEPNAYIPGIGQVVLCQTADDLTAYLQAGEYPLDYAETYGYDADFFAEKSLLLLEVGAGRTCDLWYVTNITQIGRVLNCNLLYYESDGMGPTLIYSRIQCVELNQKPTDIERLRVNVTYNQLSPRDPVSLEFAYTDATKVYKYGDVNGNDKIEAADALLVLQAVVGKTELTETQQTAADISFVFYEEAEHKVDTADALLILQIVTYSGPFKHVPPIL
ncbi:MAG: dockerin type I repeat-containing protein [Clostridia bacterium]|nr:dockerin type I repeat-containing protein [Clostridia bacterium]